MVHADASTFAEGVSKEEALRQVLDEAAGLFEGQRNWVRGHPPPKEAVSGPQSAPARMAEEGSVEDEGSRSVFVNLANAASLLWHAYKSLPSPSKDVNWAGFYVLDPASTASHPSLILGPFQGKVACQTIAFGRGVCGTAAATRQTQLVPDVDKFPGHIACDGASKSEIVVPITVDVLNPAVGSGGSGGADKKVVGIIDIDCAAAYGFDETDRAYLEELAGLLGRACDW